MVNLVYILNIYLAGVGVYFLIFFIKNINIVLTEKAKFLNKHYCM